MASNEIEILDSVTPVEKLKKIAASRALNRRHFMAALGMTGAAAGAGLLSGCTTASSPITTTTTSSPSQSAALAFVLNIKYLEATFYSYITQGKDIPSTYTYGSGAITGAPAAALTFGTTAAQLQFTDLLNEVYYDEINHVAALRTLMGSEVVARPAINLAAFGAITAANALSIARLLEDVGSSALAGVAALLTNSELTFVAQMLGAESFHAGALRLISIQNAAAAPYIPADVTLDVKPADPALTIANPFTWAGPGTAGSFFATTGGVPDATSTNEGVAFARTSSQALAILYASTAGTPAVTGTTSGGFFPSGVTGSTNVV